MQKLKGPRKAILDGSSFNESVLVFVHQAGYNRLQSISKQFSDDLDRRIKKGNGSKVIHTNRPIHLWNECDERSVDTSETKITMIKIFTQLIKVILYNPPTFLDEIIVKTIWPRRLSKGKA